MLKSIRLKNFKSFKNETLISFESKKYQYLEKNVKNGILRGAFFIGDNASGKTTVLLAIRYILDIVSFDFDVEPQFFFLTCLFNQNENSEVEYIFKIDSSIIKYKIVFNEKGFVEEKLTKNDDEIINRIGASVKILIGDNDITKEISTKQSCLRQSSFVGIFDNDNVLSKWLRFIKNSNYINAFDKRVTNSKLILNNYVKEVSCDKLNSFLKAVNSPVRCRLEKLQTKVGNKDYIFVERKDINLLLPLENESTGSQTLLNLLPTIIECIRNECMLVIDEFSAGLHIKLETLLIKYILGENNKAQLFFTSHSAGLISNTIFRPDQIYIVSFLKDNGSEIRRVSDYEPRVFQNLQKMYLNGEFGGLPNYEQI